MALAAFDNPHFNAFWLNFGSFGDRYGTDFSVLFFSCEMIYMILCLLSH